MWMPTLKRNGTVYVQLDAIVEMLLTLAATEPTDTRNRLIEMAERLKKAGANQ